MNENPDGIPADANKRKFTGIWIPAEIWEDPNIPGLAKMLYAEISSFGGAGCWKKSDELREPLGVSAETFQKLCRQLREAGYITERRAFGRIIRQSTLGFHHQQEIPGDEQPEIPANEHQEIPGVHKEYSKNKERTHKGDETVADKSPKQYGREDINEIVDLWESETGTSIKGDVNQRRQVYNLIRKHGAEATKALVMLAGEARRSGDQFAPQIATPSDLTGKFSKLERLRLWDNRRKLARPFGQSTPASAILPPPAMNADEWDRRYGADSISDEERAEVSQRFKEARKTLPFLNKGGEK